MQNRNLFGSILAKYVTRMEINILLIKLSPTKFKAGIKSCL